MPRRTLQAALADYVERIQTDRGWKATREEHAAALGRLVDDYIVATDVHRELAAVRAAAEPAAAGVRVPDRGAAGTARREGRGADMSQTIEIESIARLEVKPGETLLVTFPTGLDSLQLQGYQDEISKRLPEGVEILLVSGDVKFEVVAKEDVS